jgi:hypothetical protein
VQLLGGGGFNLSLSCWRWPFRSETGSNGIGGDQASDTNSRPGGFFWQTGVRTALSRHFYVEGRYTRTLSTESVTFYKSSITGATGWWTAGIGFWLNPRPATAHAVN